MSALAVIGVGYDPLVDKTYRLTRLGTPIVDYLASKQSLGRSAITLEDKERYLGAFALMWPQVEIDQVETRHCAHWLAQQPAGETRRTRRSHLNDFFEWAERWDLIVKNPLNRLEQQTRSRKKVYDIFTDPEVKALTSLPDLDGTLMLTMFDAMLRRSECVGLQPRHIMPPDEGAPNGQLRILAGKGDKDRLVPLTNRNCRALAEYQFVEGMGPKDFFWYTRPGGKKIRRTVKAGEASFHIWWVRCLEAADVRYRNPHMARHTGATRYLRRGGRLETLKRAMGHESIRTTEDLYSHLDTRDVALDMALIED